MPRPEIVRVSSKGQIVLPKRYRDKLGIHEGDCVLLHEVDDGLLLMEKMTESPLEAITAEIRQEAKERGFTRDDLMAAIKERRAEQKRDAA